MILIFMTYLLNRSWIILIWTAFCWLGWQYIGDVHIRQWNTISTWSHQSLWTWNGRTVAYLIAVSSA